MNVILKSRSVKTFFAAVASNQSPVVSNLMIRLSGWLHTRTALESRPHSFFFVIFEAVVSGVMIGLR